MSKTISMETKITENKLFTGNIYKFATVCDVTIYIRNILHCKDLKRATAVINQSKYREDCFPDSVNIKEDSLSFYAIVLEFNDGSVSRLMTTEDMYVESYKSVKDAVKFND